MKWWVINSYKSRPLVWFISDYQKALSRLNVVVGCFAFLCREVSLFFWFSESGSTPSILSISRSACLRAARSSGVSPGYSASSSSSSDAVSSDEQPAPRRKAFFGYIVLLPLAKVDVPFYSSISFLARSCSSLRSFACFFIWTEASATMSFTLMTVLLLND